MYVLCLYIVELKFLHVISYSVTEVFLRLNLQKSNSMHIYTINVFIHNLALTMNKMASQGMCQQSYCSGLSFPAVEGGDGWNGQLEGLSGFLVPLNNNVVS